MKNEKRKKLTQNSLAAFLEKNINNVKDHSSTITRLVFVVLIGVLIFMIWRNLDSRNKRDLFNDMKQLTAFNMSELNEEEFDNTIKSYVTKYPSGVNNATVSLLIGDLYLNRASATLSEGKRDQAIAHYETALEYFAIADKFPFKQPDSAESAVWGLAETNAALAALKEGDFLNAAKSNYERLCATWPDGVRYELATEQLNSLNRSGTAAFLVKYRQSDPALFAPNMQPRETTEPLGNIDTTMIPGDFQSPIGILNPDGETQEFDPDLTLPENREQETLQQEIQEPQEASPQETPTEIATEEAEPETSPQ